MFTTTQTLNRPSRLPLIDIAGIAGLGAIVAIHTSELSGKTEETAYLGFGYLLLIAASIVSIILLAQRDRRGWMLGGLAAASTLVGFVLTRTTGLPNATDDIGNWTEPLGMASMFVEGAVILLSAYGLGLARAEHRPGVHASLAGRVARG
jgi:hypothetical protein